MGWVIPLLAYLFIGVVVALGAITVMAYFDWKDNDFLGDFEDCFDGYFDDSIGLIAFVVFLWPVVFVCGVVVGVAFGVRFLLVSLVKAVVRKDREEW